MDSVQEIPANVNSIFVQGEKLLKYTIKCDHMFNCLDQARNLERSRI